MEDLLATFSALRGQAFDVGGWTLTIDNVTWNGRSEHLMFSVNSGAPRYWWVEVKGQRTELEGATLQQVGSRVVAHVTPMVEEVQRDEAENESLAELADTEI